MHEHMHRHVQGSVPARVHRALRDLALDLRRPVGDLVADGVLLLLRWHDRGKGLPEPTPPLTSRSNPPEGRTGEAT